MTGMVAVRAALTEALLTADWPTGVHQAVPAVGLHVADQTAFDVVSVGSVVAADQDFREAGSSRSRTETFQVEGIAAAKSDTVEDADLRVAELVGVVEATVRDDPSLGITPGAGGITVLSTEFRPRRLESMIADPGFVSVVEFVVDCKIVVRPEGA